MVTFFIVFQAVSFIFGNIDATAAEKVCRASVKTRMDVVLKTEIAGLPVQSGPIVPIMCKTIDKKLDGNEREVTKQIADLTTQCWHMFLDGEYKNIFNKLDLLYGKNRCFICYTFSIDDVDITGEEFIDYMIKTPYPYTFENLKSEDDENEKEEQKSITYLDYIQSYKGDGAVIMNNDKDFIFKKDKIYAIAFLSPDYGEDIPFVPGAIDTGTFKTLWNTYTTYNDLFFGIISTDEAKKESIYPFINKIVIDELDLIKENTKCTAIVENK